MRMWNYATSVATAASILTSTISVQAAEQMLKTELKPFNVTIRVFDPAKGSETGQTYVLPVDRPDAEHAVASTLANAASFTRKTDGDKAVPVAFTGVEIEPR